MNKMMSLTEDIKSCMRKLHINSLIKLIIRCAIYAFPFITESENFKKLTKQDKLEYIIKCISAIRSSFIYIEASLIEVSDPESGFITYDNSVYGDNFFVPKNDIEYITAEYKQSPAPYIEFLIYIIELRRAIATNFYVLENTPLSPEQEMTGDFLSCGLYAVNKLEDSLNASISNIIDSSINTSGINSNISTLLQNCILQDISILNNDEAFKQYSLIPMYGDVWNGFKQIINATEWTQFIIGLYENNLVLSNDDMYKLKERVSYGEK